MPPRESCAATSTMIVRSSSAGTPSAAPRPVVRQRARRRRTCAARWSTGPRTSRASNQTRLPRSCGCRRPNPAASAPCWPASPVTCGSSPTRTAVPGATPRGTWSRSSDRTCAPLRRRRSAGSDSSGRNGSSTCRLRLSRTAKLRTGHQVPSCMTYLALVPAAQPHPTCPPN